MILFLPTAFSAELTPLPSRILCEARRWLANLLNASVYRAPHNRAAGGWSGLGSSHRCKLLVVPHALSEVEGAGFARVGKLSEPPQVPRPARFLRESLKISLDKFLDF